jgi:predicted patatin/cPLA2 family phospholipase
MKEPETIQETTSTSPLKTGLVLEGGSMRGIYTAGVLDAFMENDLYLDGIIGVSAGALHGCSYASRQVGRSMRFFTNYRGDKRFMGGWNLLHGGEIVGSEFCYHTIPEKLDPYDYDAFTRYGTPFYAVCTNIETGQPEYLRIKDMLKEVDLMRASASMPFVSKIVEFGGKKLLDGGCSDSIPVRAFQKMGYKRNVVVLTRNEGYVKGPMNAKMIRAFYHKYPEFVKALEHRHEAYNASVRDIEAMAKKGEIFLIRPSVELNISRMESDVSKLQIAYYIGHKDALARMDDLKKWLAQTE